MKKKKPILFGIRVEKSTENWFISCHYFNIDVMGKSFIKVIFAFIKKYKYYKKYYKKLNEDECGVYALDLKDKYKKMAK